MVEIRNIEVMADGSFALRAKTYIGAAVLVANTDKAYTVPVFTDTNGTNHPADYVMFGSNGDFYLRCDNAAAIPVADITDGTGSELNPTQRYISDVTTLHLIAPATTIVTMTFFKG